MTYTKDLPTPLAPLQLYADASPDGQVESVIPIRWCVNPDLVETLRERKVEDAHVLLVTRHGDREVGRKIVPLVNEMTYLSFEYSGENEVTAIVVWGEPKALIQMSGGNYIWAVFDHDGKPYGVELFNRFTGGTARLPGEDTLHVVVPSEMFAKEPPAWVKKFATIFFDEPKEQCDTRRQFLLTIPLLPIIAVILLIGTIGSSLIGLLLVIVMGFLGLRGISLSPIWHPWKQGPIYNYNRVRDNKGSSIWIHKSDPKDGTYYGPSEHFRHPIFFVLNPVALGAAIGVGFILNAWLHLHWAWFKMMLIALIVPAALAVVAVVFVTGIRSYIENTASARSRKEREAKEQERIEYLATLEAMACNGRRDPSLSALPKQKRTVRLRAQAAKARVCRPYAK